MTAPRPTRAGRLLDYLQEMFPPAVILPLTAANYLGIAFALDALDAPHGTSPLRPGGRALAGAASVLLFSLLMRIYDELKDVESDLRLGKAGDPRYKDRAVVTGRVRVDDIVALRWGVTGLLFAINAAWLVLGRWPPLLAFGATFLVTWLAFRWFFWPAISKNLLLAFVTHNPISLVITGYAIVVQASGPHAPAINAWAVVLTIGLWTPIAAWETARKVRTEADETAYDTYSKRLGWRAAAMVPAFFIVCSIVALAAVARECGLSWAYPGVLVAAGAVATLACVRFRFAPTTRNAKLQPFAELYIAAANIGLAVALGVTRSVAM